MGKRILLLAAIIFCILSCSKDNEVKVESISLNSSQEYILVGETVVLSAVLLPEAAAASAAVEWSSSDDAVVSVTDGVVIAKHSGAATITASAANGKKSAKCNVSIGDIYIAGSKHLGVLVPSVEYKMEKCDAVYYVNENAYSLSSSCEWPRCYSIFASGSDLYLSGTAGSSLGGNAVIWKNRTISYLNTNLFLSAANEISLKTFAPDMNIYYGKLAASVFVSGNDVYAVGANDSTEATIWKNGEPTLLVQPGSWLSDAVSVCVSGSDVYVAGFESRVNGEIYSRIWKNGSVLYSSSGARALSVCVAGPDVYACGCKYIYTGDKIAVVVWKNGEETLLTSGTKAAAGNSIGVRGNDVFVVGEEETASSSIAEVWKNGKVLFLPAESKYSYAESLTVFGNKVYIAGYDYDGFQGVIAQNMKGKLWVVDADSFKVISIKEFDDIAFTSVFVK